MCVCVSVCVRERESVSVCVWFFHICTVHFDVINVLFFYQLMHNRAALKEYIYNFFSNATTCPLRLRGLPPSGCG